MYVYTYNNCYGSVPSILLTPDEGYIPATVEHLRFFSNNYVSSVPEVKEVKFPKMTHFFPETLH